MHTIFLFLNFLPFASFDGIQDEARNTDVLTVIKNLQNDVASLAKHVKLVDLKVETRLNWLDDRINNMAQDISSIKNMTKDVHIVKKILTDVLPGKSKKTPAPSCDWLNLHYYNLKEGHYWTQLGGQPKKTYCDMKGAAGTKENPGTSCKALKENHGSLKSGLYWIKLENPTEMYCDMETGEGGWTMIGKAVQTDEHVSHVWWNDLLSDDTRRLREVVSNGFLLSARGLRIMKRYIKFSEIRFYCHKQWHARRVHIRTLNNSVGQKVADYMMGYGTENDRPPSCNSYKRFVDDNSFIGQHCEEWFNQKWSGYNVNGSARMYDTPMIKIGVSPSFLFLGDDRFLVLCDDEGHEPNFSPIGEFNFFVK